MKYKKAADTLVIAKTSQALQKSIFPFLYCSHDIYVEEENEGIVKKEAVEEKELSTEDELDVIVNKCLKVIDPKNKLEAKKKNKLTLLLNNIISDYV